MDITSFVLGMKAGSGDKAQADFNANIAAATLTRNPKYLGDEEILDLRGFILPDGNYLGNVKPYAFSGFFNITHFLSWQTMLMEANVFYGSTKLKVIDLQSNNLGTIILQEGALNSLSNLESFIVRRFNDNPVKTVSFASGSTTEANSSFYVYVPREDYQTVVANIASGDDVPASRFRILEDYPEVDRWNETYTVRYFDGDVLLKTTTVKYGENASYTPTKEGSTFIGWDKDVSKVVGDMDVYAKWKLIFATSSWSEISQACEAGEAQEHFALGDTRPFTFTYNGTEYSMDLKIVGFNTEDKSDGSGKAGITVSMNKETIYAQINSTSQDVWKWETCDLRTLLNGAVLNTFDADLRNVIKTVKKDRVYYNGSANVTEYSDDKLWLPSVSEIGATGQYIIACGNSYQHSVVAPDKVTNMDGQNNWGFRIRNGHISSGKVTFTFIPSSNKTSISQTNAVNSFIMPFFCI